MLISIEFDLLSYVKYLLNSICYWKRNIFVTEIYKVLLSKNMC